MSEEDQVELMSDLSSLLTSSSTCTCTNVPAVIPACMCTKSVPVIRAGTQHRAPCLVNLNEDPREGEYLSVDIPEVRTDILPLIFPCITSLLHTFIDFVARLLLVKCILAIVVAFMLNS